MTSPVLPITIRPLIANDLNFVYDTWLMSYRNTLMPEGGARDKFYRMMRKRVSMLLLRGAKALVAVDPSEPDYIYGFICAEENLLHYVYVKDAYRGNGVSLQLTAEAGLGGASPLFCTHWSTAFDRISIKKPGALRYIGTDVPAVMEGIDAIAGRTAVIAGS